MRSVELVGIDKYFPSSGTWALIQARLSLNPGEIHAVVGENGAGKTTLMKILAGLERPDSGQIRIRGRTVEFKNPAEATRFGIGMVHQHFMTIPGLNAAENILFGAEPRTVFGLLDKKAVLRKAADCAAGYGFSLDVRRNAESLSVGERQQVEILRLLQKNCDILILDEPTSVLTDQEIRSFFSVLRQLKASGKTIVIISHKVGEIKKIADRLSVMKDGRFLGEYKATDISNHALSDLIMGEYESPRLKAKAFPPRPAPTILEIKNLSLHKFKRKAHALRDINLSVGGGEILGICALANNGLSELEDLLAGRLKPDEGGVFFQGRPYPKLRKAPWLDGGIAYVPSDRIGRGSCSDRSVAENIVALDRGSFFPHGLLDSAKAQARTLKAIQVLGVKARPESKISQLSGGNIQKMILGRELSEPPAKLCLLCEPGWGLDYASLRRTYKRILEIRSRGSAVVLISSDIDEIMELSDRIAVLHKGGLTGLVTNGPGITKSKLGALMMGLENVYSGSRGTAGRDHE
ncbi:Ribose import ATP-binding protein RbsA [bioreactor metagenome]|jgi:simple sugar transport system ATP-binding protein|uniref:Ribose import ATP-binding protein RbsA n=1 Tax=bioreactor metagenome TaxID=1076179 RepID=A0A644SX91_9ZZZZ|nr:ABC transporter ATP-binding protein [Treponema sp.]